MVSNYASGRKHAKHRYILAVNLPDTFRCPKRQIATKKYKIICLSSMCCLKQKKQQYKVQFTHCLFTICPRLRAAVYTRFNKSGRHLEFSMNDVIRGKIIHVAKMATKDESSVDVDFAVCSYKKECFYFISRGIFSLYNVFMGMLS